MEKRLKNRFALLGILLAAGIFLVGIRGALGAGNVFNMIKEEFRAGANGEPDLVCEEFHMEGSDRYVKLHMENVDTDMNLHISKEESDRFFEIVKTDKGVIELIEGKEYDLISSIYTNEFIRTRGTDHQDVEEIKEKMSIRGKYQKVKRSTAIDADIVVLTIKIEEKLYQIVVDIKTESVRSIEELKYGILKLCYRSG